jgi:hypothetical protein
MNSLRSDTNRDSYQRLTKSQNRTQTSIERLSNISPLQSSYKPKLTQIKHGLVERQKKKFVKKIDSLSFEKSYTPVNLKTAETSKDNISTSHFHDYRKPTSEVVQSKMRSVHLVINNTSSAKKNLSPAKYNLQKEPAKLGSKPTGTKKWTFEDFKASVSVDKSRSRNASKTLETPATNQKSLSNSKMSSTTKVTSTSKKVAKTISNEKSLSPQKPSVSKEKKIKVEEKNTSSKSREGSVTKVSKISTSKTEHVTNIKVSTTVIAEDSVKEKAVSGRVAALARQLESSNASNPGIDTKVDAIPEINATFTALKSLTPVKPSNIVGDAGSPECLGTFFTPLMKAKVYESVPLNKADTVARKEELPDQKPDLAEDTETKIEVTQATEDRIETEPPIEVPDGGEEHKENQSKNIELSEEFEFDDDDDPNAVVDDQDNEPDLNQVPEEAPVEESADLGKDQELVSHTVIRQSVHVEVTETRTDNITGTITTTTTTEIRTFEETAPDLSPIVDKGDVPNEEDEEFDFGDDDDNVDVNQVVSQLEPATTQKPEVDIEPEANQPTTETNTEPQADPIVEAQDGPEMDDDELFLDDEDDDVDPNA